jgi:hypothetical protein
MKHLFNWPIALIFLVIACKNSKKSKPGAEGSDTTQTAAPIISDWQKKIEELQQLSPYTIGQMRALLPAILAGDSASSMDAGTNMGTGFARAVYPINDSATIELSLFDCGDNAGAGIYQAQFINQLDNQSETDNEYTRTIEFKGDKAIEHADKGDHTASLTYMVDRLLVVLEGKNTGVDELKKIGKDLKMK